MTNPPQITNPAALAVRILTGDCRETLKTLPDESVNCCVTSPPYYALRNYQHENQIGLESTPSDYVAQMVQVFREVRRVLRKDGVAWVNLGDSYNAYNGNRGRSESLSRATEQAMPTSARGLTTDFVKNKDLLGIPWRVAFALQADGWYLRQDIIWHKPNPMPESVTDRCTKAHEYIFLLSKSARYWYDAEAIQEVAIAGYNGSTFTSGKTRMHREQLSATSNAPRIESEYRNRRSVWTVPTFPYSEAHFATYPPDLIKPCILAGCPAGGTVLDPFGGSGTTGAVALELGRKAILCELNPDYVKLIEKRTNITPGFAI